MNTLHPDRLAGVLFGTAVGDALGLPAEGLKPKTIAAYGWANSLRHRFIGQFGMWSDDTEHTIMLAQSLAKHPNDLAHFTRSFAWELRWWILSFPAGVGLATARSIVRLWLGFSPSRSGVFSAGNGPCMRAALVGAYFRDDKAKRQSHTKAHTELTHSDPRALIAAYAIAEVAALNANSKEAPANEDVMRVIDSDANNAEWTTLVSKIESSWKQNLSPQEFLDLIGGDSERGISGYAFQTAPMVIYIGGLHLWNYEQTIGAIIEVGGDTDTTAAIAGAVCGALHGKAGIPNHWLHGVREWPTPIHSLEELANALSQGTSIRVRPRLSPFLILRNLFFLLVVLTHGFRRLVPR